jgi:ankyrin repeat protein
VGKRYPEIVLLLLEAGADITAGSSSHPGRGYETAVVRGGVTILQHFHNRGADPNSQFGGRYGSPLIAAARTVPYDIEFGYDFDFDSDSPTTVNIFDSPAQESYDSTETLRYLLDFGADVNAASDGPYGSALIAAVRRGHEGAVQLLLDKGANINTYVECGCYGSAIVAAVRRVAETHGDLSVVRLLLESGADPNTQATNLHGNPIAAAESNLNVIHLLHEFGAVGGAEERKARSTPLWMSTSSYSYDSSVDNSE